MLALREVTVELIVQLLVRPSLARIRRRDELEGVGQQGLGRDLLVAWGTWEQVGVYRSKN